MRMQFVDGLLGKLLDEVSVIDIVFDEVKNAVCVHATPGKY